MAKISDIELAIQWLDCYEEEEAEANEAQAAGNLSFANSCREHASNFAKAQRSMRGVEEE